MNSALRVARCGLALVIMALYLAVLAAGCARRAAPPASAVPPDPPAPIVEPPEPASPPPAGQLPVADHYPPHVYHVKGPGVHRLAENVRVWNGGGPYGEEYYLWDYWFVDADPVTIEIRFAEAIPDPAGAILQIREALAGAVIHEEGYEADRVFVRATLPPGRNFVMLWDIRLADAPTIEPPGVILDRGRPFRLMYWLPGGTPEVLGDYILPKLPFRAAPVAEREKAVFGTFVFGLGEAHIAKTSLWHWQPDAQPPLSPLPGEWYGRAREMVFPRGDDLVIKRADSVVVADWSGQLIATLVEDREQMGTAVGPEGEIAAFTRRRDDQGGLILDLTIFSANLEERQTWEAIYPHGTFTDYHPTVEPIWHGNEILFLALDDRWPLDRADYNLMAFDVMAGSVRRLAGPFAAPHHARRLGLSHYALREHGGASWVLFDVTTASLRILPSAAELGLPPSHSFAPMAVNGEWIVFQLGGEELLAWHPTAGLTRLGPAEPMNVFTMGEGFGWWIDTASGR